MATAAQTKGAEKDKQCMFLFFLQFPFIVLLLLLYAPQEQKL
jgi:hypothetical protein